MNFPLHVDPRFSDVQAVLEEAYERLHSVLEDYHPEAGVRPLVDAVEEVFVGSRSGLFSVVARLFGYSPTIGTSDDMWSCGACRRKSMNMTMCAGCHAFFYCDRQCQSFHWTRGHKAVCTKLRNSSAA